jgi:predicted RNase H-like nuclease (RuvC/YqgF family)
MDKKNILTKIKELFNTEVEKFEGMDYKTQDGRILRVMGGMDVGTKVMEITPDGEMNVEDGNYVLEDGMVLIIKGGMIESVEETTDEMEEITDTITEDVEMGDDMKDRMEDGYKNEIDTKLVDGTEIRVLTKGEAISVGDMVLVKVGEGYKEAPEGRHEVEGGLVVYTDAEGNINEIETKETEEEDEMGNMKDKEEMSELFNSITKLVDEVKSLRTELGEIKNENVELKSKFSKFSKEPSEEPTKHEIKFSGKMTKDDKLKFFGR